MDRPTIAELLKAIKGTNFPANKDEIIKQAKDNNADINLIRSLKKLEDINFKSATEVSKAFASQFRNEFYS